MILRLTTNDILKLAKMKCWQFSKLNTGGKKKKQNFIKVNNNSSYSNYVKIHDK